MKCRRRRRTIIQRDPLNVAEGIKLNTARDVEHVTNGTTDALLLESGDALGQIVAGPDHDVVRELS